MFQTLMSNYWQAKPSLRLPSIGKSQAGYLSHQLAPLPGKKLTVFQNGSPVTNCVCIAQKPAYVMGNSYEAPKQPKVSSIDDSQCDAIRGSFHFWWCYSWNFNRSHSCIHQPNNIKVDGYLKKQKVITLIDLSTRYNSIDAIAIIQLGLLLICW